MRVTVPRIEDYVILKLVAASADHRRRARDLVDVEFALAVQPPNPAVSVAAVCARLRDVYGITGQRLKDLVGLLRARVAPEVCTAVSEKCALTLITLILSRR